jgi:cytochrome o ubiquinol oxidase subunit 2
MLVAVRSLIVITLLATLGGCGATVLSPIGPVGAAERTILLDALAIMLAIVVPTLVATLVFAWWYRSSNTRARYLPNFQYSGQLELLVWSVPTLVVLFLGGIAWISSHDLDPAEPLTWAAPAQKRVAPLEVQVVSLDWKWLFIYPDEHVASLNRLVVPTGIPLHLRVTSATVMNVFFVPRLGSEIYSMSGMATQINLQADQAGSYPGLSANFSGDGFSDMHFSLDAVDREQFDTWVTRARTTGPVLNDTAYRGLLRQSANIRPSTYRDVETGLFDRIVSLQLPPGEGPPAAPSSSAGEP